MSQNSFDYGTLFLPLKVIFHEIVKIKNSTGIDLITLKKKDLYLLLTFLMLF